MQIEFASAFFVIFCRISLLFKQFSYFFRFSLFFLSFFRITAQSIIPGILEREQEQSVVYGSVDFGKTVVSSEVSLARLFVSHLPKGFMPCSFVMNDTFKNEFLQALNILQKIIFEKNIWVFASAIFRDLYLIVSPIYIKFCSGHRNSKNSCVHLLVQMLVLGWKYKILVAHVPMYYCSCKMQNGFVKKLTLF